MLLNIDDADWLPRATRIDRFVCDVAFRIVPDVYVGPDNGMSRLQYEKMRVDLAPPGLPVVGPDGVLAESLLGREDQLARYYERLVAIAVRQGKQKSLATPFPYFSSRPVIRVEGKSLFSFMLYDEFYGVIEVLKALAERRGPECAEVLDNLDQHWAIRILSQNGWTYILEWDCDDDDDVLAGYVFESGELNRQAAAALERYRSIHGRLVERLGHDYWTYVQPTA